METTSLPTIKTATWTMDSLAAKLDKFNKKLAKRGLGKARVLSSKWIKPHVVQVSFDTMETTPAYWLHEIEVPVEFIQIAGHAPLAHLAAATEDSLVVTPLSQEEGLEDTLLAFRTPASLRCDHCKTNRARKSAWVFRYEGQIKVIAASCAKDYFGAESASFLRDYMGEVTDPWTTGGDSAHSDRYAAFVTAAIWAIKRFGFMSKKAAADGGMTTESTAHWLISPPDPKESKEDKQTRAEFVAAFKDTLPCVEAAIEWWKVQDPAKLDLFESNCRATVLSGSTRRGTGLLVYGLLKWFKATDPGYRDAEAFKKANEASTRTNEWLTGAVGDKVRFEGMLTFKRFMDGEFPMTLLKFLTSTGHELAWFASNPPEWAEVGVKVTGTATIKKFETYQDQKTTTITRAKLEKA